MKPAYLLGTLACGLCVHARRFPAAGLVGRQWGGGGGGFGGGWGGGGGSGGGGGAACEWTGHCLGDACETEIDCDGDLTCRAGRCANPGVSQPGGWPTPTTIIWTTTVYVTTWPTPTSNPTCEWTGHCAGDPCEEDTDCDGDLSCRGGRCGGVGVPPIIITSTRRVTTSTRRVTTTTRRVTVPPVPTRSTSRPQPTTTRQPAPACGDNPLACIGLSCETDADCGFDLIICKDGSRYVRLTPPILEPSPGGGGQRRASPPPASVASAIPRFHLHGEHNCGDHRHDITDPKFLRRRSFVRQGGSSSSKAGSTTTASASSSTTPPWLLACSRCHARVTLNCLHDLPCGDLLCRDCLVVAALSVKLEIEKRPGIIWNTRVNMADTRIRLAAITTTTTTTAATNKAATDPQERKKKRLVQRHAEYHKEVLRLAGLTCCGLDMQLERFLPCLSPAVSRDLWLAIRWVACDEEPAEQRACAWPDCGAYLPVCCRYEMPGVEGYARRWYCVVCQGNSMECARKLRVEQRSFPFLPKGQPALTPSR
ncbi:uncharacterized protein B0T15DRAFT_510894 [Chaetomium strumarium]|uniref:Uncharacterized protein n=1 Tax=Chaetomium strumarium TaxID=1170767 RepID=A0AAJ0GWW4_9PEZI|nr:hypothetical protein B0T15DRAFT_510894 [Chaetomium strumarium]